MVTAVEPRNSSA